MKGPGCGVVSPAASTGTVRSTARGSDGSAGSAASSIGVSEREITGLSGVPLKVCSRPERVESSL